MAEEDVTLLAHIRAIDEGASEVFDGLRNVAGAAGIALVGVFKASADSALKYSESVEKVAFLTGQSTEKASGLIAAFRAQGFTTDEATQSMQRLTMRLGSIDTQFRSTHKLSAQNTQSLKEMGISVKDLEASGGDLTVLLPKIIDHMKNMTDPLERDKLAMQLFGRNFGAIAPLINAGGDAFVKATGDAKLFGVELTANQVIAFHAWKSAQETSKEALQGLTIQLGEYALPALMAVENATKSLAAFWQKLSPQTKELTLHIAGLTAIFGTLFGGASSVSSILKTVTSNMGPLGLLIGAIAEPLLMVGAALGLVAGAFLIVRNEWEHSVEIQKAFAPVLHGVVFALQELKYIWDQVVSIAVDFFNALAGGSRTNLDHFIASLAGPLSNALGVVHVFLGRVMAFLQDNHAAIVAFAGVIRGVVINALTFLHQALTVIIRVAEYLWSKTWPALQSAMVQLQPVVAELVGVWRDDLMPTFQALVPILQVVATIVIAALGVAIPIAIQLAVTAIKLFVDLFRIVAIVVRGVVQIVNDLIHGNWKQAWEHAKEMVRDLVPAVKHYIQDLWDGIVHIFGGLWGAISGYVSGLVNGIIGWFTSLGTRANSIWSDFANRPIYWIVYLAAKAVEFILGLDLRIGQILAELAGKALKFGLQFAAAILQEIPKLPGQIATWLGTVASTIIDAIPGLVKNGTKMGKDFVSAVVTALGSLLTSVPSIIGSAFGNAAGQARQALHDAHVPGFAEGGIVGPGYGGARMAVVGEGKEAEVIAKASSLIKAGMAAASSGGGGGFGNVTIEYHVDGRLIERRTSKITGKRMRLQGAGTGSAA